jgi:DNA helicase IV
LAEKLVEHGHHNPRKYLHDFSANIDSPYFGIIGIDDFDSKIGRKEYLIGKQTLLDGNRVVVVDWRKAELSRLFYDYEQGKSTWRQSRREGEGPRSRTRSASAGFTG